MLQLMKELFGTGKIFICLDREGAYLQEAKFSENLLDDYVRKFLSRNFREFYGEF